MKFNWGTGIFIFITLFLAGAFTMIIWSLGLDFNLVEKDYYPKGLRYDQMKSKMDNTSGLSEKITASPGPESIVLQFPSLVKGRVTGGRIWVYRPSDERLDLNLPVSPDSSGRQVIPRQHLVKGKYILKLDWNLDRTLYYQEIELYLP